MNEYKYKLVSTVEDRPLYTNSRIFIIRTDDGKQKEMARERAMDIISEYPSMIKTWKLFDLNTNESTLMNTYTWN